MSQPDKININIHRPGEPKSEELICNWCKLPHSVEPSYKEDVLERGAEKIAELKAENQKNPKHPDDDLTESILETITPEETWTCGKCLAHLMGLPSSTPTECEHEVPTERVIPS